MSEGPAMWRVCIILGDKRYIHSTEKYDKLLSDMTVV